MRERLLLVATALSFVIAATVASFRPWPPPEQTPESPAAPANEVRLAREPFLGVACPEPNDIRCDRVKIGIWVSEPVRHVEASIRGARFDTGALALGDEALGTFWQGILQPAGLLDGPLRLPARVLRDGKWFGEDAPRVEVRIVLRGVGRRVVEAVRVPLRPGYG